MSERFTDKTLRSSRLIVVALLKWITQCAAVFLLILVLPTAVSAHASLVRSDPAPNSILTRPPAQVQLWFDEEVDPHFSKIEVLGPDQSQVVTGQLQAAPDDAKSIIVPLNHLESDTYTVKWQVLSADDGHITEGTFSFGVGVANLAGTPGAAQGPGSELSPISAAVRWLNLLALLALVGGMVFRLLLLDPSFHAIRANEQDAIRSGLARWRAATLIIAGVALLAGLADLLLQAISIGGSVSPGSLQSVVFSTRLGLLGLARIILVVAAGASVLFSHRFLSLLVPAAALGALALLTRSLTSHGAAVQGDLSLGVLSDWLHFLSVSMWVGGVVYFALLLPLLWRALAPEIRTHWVSTLLARFSAVALVATPIVALTGLYNATLQVPSLDALTGTLYGDTLLAKVALFGVMVLFGAFNLLLLSPRLRSAIAVPASAGKLVSRFRLTLAAEVVVGLAVVLLAGLLTLELPARSEMAARATPTAAAQARVLLVGDAAPGIRVELVIGPLPESPSEFDVRVVDSEQKPVTGITGVVLDFTRLNADSGEQVADAEPRGDGHYMAMGNYLDAAGMWRLRVTVQRLGTSDAAIEFPYLISNSAKAASDPEALRFVAQSEAVMNRLLSLRSDQYLNDGANGEVVTHFEFRAPDKMRFTVEGQGDSVAIGPVQYYRDKAGAWSQQGRVDPFVFPDFNLSSQATWAALGIADTVRSQPARVVLFSIKNTSGSGEIDYAYWISTQDHRLLQLGMVTDGHFMMQSYFDADAPDIVIQAPASVPPAGMGGTTSATPAPAPAPAPLTSNRRPRGLITGDLEADGGLVLLIAGIAALAGGLIG
ncbi:MAG: copper resistance CopC/CopD family protein, partial [Rudaea sp.]